jgi:hypothetical protein
VAEIERKKLKGLRLLRTFDKVLERASRRHGDDDSHKRQQSQYLRLFLLGVINPVVRSMRALCEASQSSAVQLSAGVEAFTRSRFSEMQHVVEPALLEEIFKELAQAVQKQHPTPVGKVSWRIVDSSVFDVLQRMDWAYFKMHRGQPKSAIRLHVSLDLLSSVPLEAKITPAKVCERAIWKTQWKAGAGEIGDRNYSQNYRLLRLLEIRQSWYILRLREKQTHVTVIEELPLTAADRVAGVTRQVWGYLGKSDKKRSPRVRIIWVQPAQGDLLMLVTNQTVAQMPAELISQAYRHRWQVELFFRWIKCVMQCRHFLAESPQGVTIQLYLALIGAVLIQLHLGRRPSRRLWEAIQFYFLGIFSQKDLAAAVEKEKARIAAKAAKKS